jgi:predicted kinase
MEAIILQGIQGSGKSTLAAMLRQQVEDAAIVSADDYFLEEGVFCFDATKLTEAHNACLLGFLKNLQERRARVIVDNTNSTIAEIAPYGALAQAFGYSVEIITILADPVWHGRRNLHAAPLSAVWATWKRIEACEIPARWKRTVVAAE